MIFLRMAMALVVVAGIWEVSAHDITEYEHDDDLDAYHGDLDTPCVCETKCDVWDADDYYESGIYSYCDTTTWTCREQAGLYLQGLGYIRCDSTHTRPEGKMEGSLSNACECAGSCNIWTDDDYYDEVSCVWVILFKLGMAESN